MDVGVTNYSIDKVIQNINNGGELIVLDGDYYDYYLRNDRVICSIITDDIFNNNKFNKIIIEAKGINTTTNNINTETFISNKMLNYESLIASIYRLRIENLALNKVVNIQIGKGRAILNAMVNIDNKLEVTIENGYDLMLEQSIVDYNQRKFEPHHAALLRIEGNREIAMIDAQSTFDKAFKTIDTYRVKSENNTMEILESENCVEVLCDQYILIVDFNKNIMESCNRYIDVGSKISISSGNKYNINYIGYMLMI